MSEDRFKVVTTDGVLVFKGSDKHDTGLERVMADGDCAVRNRKAEDLGLSVRYEVVPLGGES